MNDRQKESIREFFKIINGMGKISYFYLSESLENMDYIPDPAAPEEIRNCILNFISGEYLLQMDSGESIHYIIEFGIHFQVIHLPDHDGFLLKGPFRYQEPHDLETDGYLDRYGMAKSDINRHLVKNYLTEITNAHASTEPLVYACIYLLGKSEQDFAALDKKIYLEGEPKETESEEPLRSQNLQDLQTLRCLDEKYARELELRSMIAQGKRKKAGTLLQNWDSTVYIGHKERNMTLRLLELNIICKQAMLDAHIPSTYIEKTYASVIRELVSESRSIGKNENQYSAHMLDIYCKLARDYTTQNFSTHVKRAVDYILSNYKEKMEIKDIAEYAGLSPNYLCARFKKETGETLVHYIGKIRIGSSLTLLTNTELSVSEVAEKTGFSDGNYFTRIFKKQMKMNPTEYRKKYRAASEEMYQYKQNTEK